MNPTEKLAKYVLRRCCQQGLTMLCRTRDLHIESIQISGDRVHIEARMDATARDYTYHAPTCRWHDGPGVHPCTCGKGEEPTRPKPDRLTARRWGT